MQAIIYARYSTDMQSEQSTADQLRVCRDYAKKQKWPIGAEYTDEAISGAALGNRPGALAALAALNTGDVLLINDTSRLQRSQDLAPMIARLRHRGVRVIGVKDNFDSESPTARLQAGMSGMFSEEFRAQISSRTHSALDMRAREGRATGGKCYGYNNAGEIVETEADIVREIFRRVAKGEAMRAVAADLNARGVPSAGAAWSRKSRRNDGFWLVSAIHAIVHNERYIGRVIWNRSMWRRDPDTGRRQRVERPESEWIVREGPAIIDCATFDAVQTAAKPRKLHGGGKGHPPGYLLSGILVCGECGGKMVVNGRDGMHYYCGTRKHGGDSACSMSLSTRRDVAEELILGPIERELLSPEAVSRAVELIQQWSREDRAQGAQPAEVAQVDERISRLEGQVTAGVLEREDVAASLAALHERRRALLAAAWSRTSGKAGAKASAAALAYREAAAKYRETLKGPALTLARSALHDLLGEVVCRPENGHLVASLGLNPLPLLRSAGVSQTGSGGRI